jgi:hypothetical protein
VTTPWAATPVTRKLSPAQATEMVGDPVGEMEPNVFGPTVFYDSASEEPVLAYLPVEGKAELRRAVMGIKYGQVPRASGMNSMSRTFGSSPRRPVYGRDGCHQSLVMSESREAGQALSRWADHLGAMLAGFAPQQAAQDRETMAVVDRDWKLGDDSLWTSGVINRSSRLPYHRDSFNFPTWSAMPVLRRGMSGGFLSVPEYDLVLPCRDGYAVFFPGHELIHGVTPMQATAPDGYRYSIVYYALRGMKDCFTAALETEYAKKMRTTREQDIVRREALLAAAAPGELDGDDLITRKALWEVHNGPGRSKPELVRAIGSNSSLAGQRLKALIASGRVTVTDSAVYPVTIAEPDPHEEIRP